MNMTRRGTDICMILPVCVYLFGLFFFFTVCGSVQLCQGDQEMARQRWKDGQSKGNQFVSQGV